MNTMSVQATNQENVGVTSESGVRTRSPITYRKRATKPFSVDQMRTLETTLQRIFPTQQEDTRIQRARQIMGVEIRELTDEELESYLTQFQYLIDAWIDTYEKDIFEGLTLRQVLKEG